MLAESFHTRSFKGPLQHWLTKHWHTNSNTADKVNKKNRQASKNLFKMWRIKGLLKANNQIKLILKAISNDPGYKTESLAQRKNRFEVGTLVPLRFDPYIAIQILSKNFKTTVHLQARHTEPRKNREGCPMATKF